VAGWVRVGFVGGKGGPGKGIPELNVEISNKSQRQVRNVQNSAYVCLGHLGLVCVFGSVWDLVFAIGDFLTYLLFTPVYGSNGASASSTAKLSFSLPMVMSM
jgi:hypothetical protein